jgi:hypothetical protein
VLDITAVKEPLLETVFHVVDGFGDRDLLEEELCRTEIRRKLTRVEVSRIFVEESLVCKEAGSIWKRCGRSFSLSHKLTFTPSWWKYLSALFENNDERERESND